MAVFELLVLLLAISQVSFGLGHHGGNQSHPQERPTTNVSSALIPRELLIGGDDYRSVRLSPDGKTLAYLAPYMGVTNIWIRRLAPACAPYPLTKQRNRPIHALTWAFDIDGAQTILYLQDTAGEENYRLFAVNTRGSKAGQSRMLTPATGVRALLVHMSASKPNRVMVALNQRNQSCHDFYLVDIRSGRRSLYFENTACFAGAIFDDSYCLRVLAKQNGLGGVDYFKVDKEEANLTLTTTMAPPTGSSEKNGFRMVKIHLLRSVGPDETSSTTPLQLDASGEILYWLDASESDKGLLIAEKMETGERKVLYEPVTSELIACTFHPVSGRPLFVYESYLRPRHATVPLGNGGVGEHEEHRAASVAWRHLRNSFPSDVEPFIVSVSHDFSAWLVVTQSENEPVSYWIYRAPSLTYLFSKNEHVMRYELAHRKAVEVPTDDGWTELCYLTLPANQVHDPEQNFRPSRPLPMVLFVHGGPWARDRWGFHNEAQLMANRGYAVLQCNYRGSVGFGKAFANAGDGQWGGRMQQDLTDAVRWAINEKIARADKVAIAGFSYGGYAALAGLTTTPDLYACAIDAVGPSNLLTLMRTLPPYWSPAFNMFKRRLGADPLTAEGRQKLKDASPFFHADKIRRPLLVAHGVHDPRVKLQESDMIVRAAKANNVSVTYVTFEDEGHGFRRPENNMAFWALAERFLRTCLGGEAEPMLDTLEKSTARF